MKPERRNTEVDMIRTLALIGICVVNVPFMALPAEAQVLAPDTLADQIALFAVEAFFQGKFFLLFSFIFGWGLHIQAASAARAGVSFGARYSRRLLGLGVIGAAHAILVFSGDILVLYACLGVLIWPVRNWSARALMRLAFGMTPVAAIALALVAIAVSESGIPPSVGAGLGGSYLEATATRLRDWPTTFVFIALFNGPLAFGAFAAGLAAAKSDFFRPGHPVFTRLQRAAPLLLLAGMPLNIAYAATLSEFAATWPAAVQGLAFVGLAIGGPMLSVTYLLAIVALARRLKPRGSLLASGRNSLTGYVTDGILAGFVFGGYGLGLFGALGHAALFGAALAIALSGGLIATAWDRFSPQGPLETLLRRITYGRPATAPGA